MDVDASFAKKEEQATPPPLSEDQLQLETLDVTAILTQGKKLLGSAGQQYDFALAHLDPAQRLAHQKKSLSARLGLGGEYTEEELIDEGDLKSGNDGSSPLQPLRKLNTLVDRTSSMSEYSASPHDSIPPTPGGEEGSLSKRQLNMLKRKSKKDMKYQANKVRVVDFSERRLSITSSTAPEPLAIKRESSAQTESNGPADYFNLDRPNGGDDESKVVAEFKGPAAPTKSELQPETEEEGIDWPFERLCEYLMVDMFDHNWEVRHGAAMGLREVLRVHGSGAGRQRGDTRVQNDLLNQRWLDDLACRLCCIFMLDRFGDYVSDQVVAPVRETAGQTLGSILQHMPASSVSSTYLILQRLIVQEESLDRRVWQACHGGMIGMRYLVAVRGDLLLQDPDLMSGVLDVVVKGLADFDDDVRAVSAATLIPVSEEVITLRPSALVDLVNVIWDCLSNLSDDLSASTGSVMDLLAKLCGFSQVLEVMKSNAANDPNQSFANLVPRLYPFLRHTITGVRSAVLRALKTFLSIKGDGTQDWIDGRALRLLYQNLLVERNEGVLKLTLEVWMAAIDPIASQGEDKLEAQFASHLQPMLTLTLHPIGVARNHIPMDPSLLIRPSGQVFALPNYTPAKSPPKSSLDQPAKRGRRKSKQDGDVTPQPISAHNIDGPMVQGDVDLVGLDVMIRSKTFAAKALAKVMTLWPVSSKIATFESQVNQALQSPFSSSRVTSAIICEEYAKLLFLPQQDDLGKNLTASLHRIVEVDDQAFFADLKSYLSTAQQYCRSLNYIFESTARIDSRALPHVGSTLAVAGEDWSKYSFSVQQGESVIGADFDKAKAAMTPAHRIFLQQSLEDAKTDAQRAIREAKTMQEQRLIRIKATAAAAIVAFKDVPKKQSLTIKGIMNSVKFEENAELQKRSASAVVSLTKLMVASGKRVVIEKVVGNLVNFYCTDLSETPDFRFNMEIESGLLSLRKDEDIADHADPEQFERDAKAARIQRRGAREALTQLSTDFGADLLNEIPILKTTIQNPLNEAFSAETLTETIINDSDNLGQRLIDGLSTLRAIVPTLHKDVHVFVLELLPKIVSAVKCKLAVLRYAAAKCLATICSVITVQGFTTLVKEVLPSINNATDPYQRQGAIECVYHLIHVMEDGILPYVIFLIVPVLGRMSDSDNDIRLIATTAFATLVKLVPLEAGIPDPPGLSEELLHGRERERKFMSQMLDFKKVEPFDIPVAIKADLRSYQQEGVNWLAFLNRYHLHGVLCDDMGLGKTLQTLCIVASDHHMRAEEYSKTQSADTRRLPSLIVCPPTLSGHWQQEIRQFAPFLKAVAFVGSPGEREAAKARVKDADIVITSYEICRNSIEYLAPFNWNYCVLDEGHLIKNPAAKTSLAVKRLISNHRLILSGTPIQNNVLELWSLFDFLMPGFLGTEKVFKDRFAKSIAASRFSKSSSKEQEAGALAIEALHKQVLPFLLRRLKEEVLDDLPPKIIQNYYCELSELQRKLFTDLTKSQGKALSDMATAGDKESKQHIFTALNYMRKVCNSPKLVMKPENKHYAATQAWLSAAHQNKDIRDPSHAPKLGALCQLLIDCGIGTADAFSGSGGPNEPPSAISQAVSQHRVLIFCQMKEMLDIVQEDVLKRMLPSVTYLRLDGSVEANRRQDIVNKFNGDPSIDVLLLTTSVGGLGLNLTGADTVIFVEHDWNPQKDIQAMDRAHRIGQKKVVNVYRLITRGTLEEKILNLQRFKIDVASTVVNQQNTGLATMETDQILDLFNLSEGAEGAEGQNTAADEGVGAVDEVTGEVKEKGKKGFLEDLGELWDENQYDEEFNIDGFLEKIKL